MITAEEFVQELNSEEKQNNFKLATVVELFENGTAKIQFDGEDVPSEKQYAYLSSYAPEAGDRILLIALGGTYVILGKVNFNENPDQEQDEDEEYDRYVFDEKKVEVKKGIDIVGGADVDSLTADDAAIDGDLGVSGTIMAQAVSTSGQVSGGSLSTSGELSAGKSSLGSTTVSSLVSNGDARIEGDLRHRGSYIGFFRATPTYKRKVTLVGDDLHYVRLALSDLLSALSAYGLIDN